MYKEGERGGGGGGGALLGPHNCSRKEPIWGGGGGVPKLLHLRAGGPLHRGGNFSVHMIVDTDSVGTAYFLSLQCSKLGPNFDRTFGRPILTLGGHCQICSDILICMHVCL